MKLGEVKLQAIRIGFPDFFISYDETDEASLIGAVASLKQDSNFNGFLESTIGSINRALAYIESKGLCQVKCVDLPQSQALVREDGRAALPIPSDALKIDKIVWHKGRDIKSLSFEIMDGTALTENKDGIYRIIYKRKIPRVNSVMGDACNLEAPFGLVEYIPYFVASDILGRECEHASDWREYFEEMVEAECGRESPCYSCIEAKYFMV